MSVRPILIYPDPALRKAAAPVTDFDPVLRGLAADLLDTLLAAPGIGITGPHIGVLWHVTVIRMPEDLLPRTYINPAVVWRSTETARHTEGSLSMPGVAEEVERPARVRVAFQDIDGSAREVAAEGFFAACLQHEIDQLDGVFWLRRISALKRERILKRWLKQQRAGN